jgi:4-carboxymuconolactone decarboxylase
MRGEQVDKERFNSGHQVRCDVMGAERIENVMKNADSFTRPIHNLITEYCWGEIWTRPGLDRKTRSLLNLAMLAALNRQNELRLHITGALNNGVTPEEMMECFGNPPVKQYQPEVEFSRNLPRGGSLEEIAIYRQPDFGRSEAG